MNRRIKPLFLQGAIEVQLHVSSALELFENHFVHAAAGFGQRGRENGQAAAFLGVAGGAEKLLWLGQRFRFDTAGHGSALAGLQADYSRGKAGDAVEQDDDVLFSSTRRLARSSTSSATCTWRLNIFIEVRMINLTIDFAREVSHLLGPFVHQQHDQHNLGMIHPDSLGNFL